MTDITKSQKIRLTAFIIITSSILIISLIIITGSKLLKKSDIYFIRYKNISIAGLEVGASVKYNGIRIGRVEDIYIDPEDINAIIIKISVKRNTPIVEDSKAIISTLGITGLKIIEIRGGSNTAKRLKPNSFIPSGISGIDVITGKAEIIMNKIEILINNLNEITSAQNQQKLAELLVNMDSTFKKSNELLSKNQNLINDIVLKTNTAMNNISSTTEELKLVIKKINQTLQSKEFDNMVSNYYELSQKLNNRKIDSILFNLNKLLITSSLTMTTFNNTLTKSRTDLIRTLLILKETSENLNEFSRLISEDPSILIRGGKLPEIKNPK